MTLSVTIAGGSVRLAKGAWFLTAPTDRAAQWLEFYRWLAGRADKPHEREAREADVRAIEDAMRGAGLPVPAPTKRKTK